MTFSLPSSFVRKTTRTGAAIGLVAVTLLGLSGAQPAAASDSPHKTIDITFPAVKGSTFSDDYTASRGGGTRMHCGTDLFNKKHTHIYAAMGGTITSMPTTKPSYGYAINIAGDDGRKYVYIHLNDDTPGTRDAKAGPQHAYAPGLKRGDRVRRGQHIGYMGDSGNAKGGAVHLHFEIHDPKVNVDRCTNGGGPQRMNPFHSLRAAVNRGDFGPKGASAPPAPVRTARGIDRACPTHAKANAFVDVAGNGHAGAINCVAFWNIAGGVGGGRFAPEQPINREQLASLIVRTLDAVGRPLPAATRDHFADDHRSVHQDNINRVAEAGLVSGIRPGVYAPGNQVSRGQMATFVARTYAHAAGQQLPKGPDAFRDDNGDVHEDNINRLAEARITAGSADGRFQPLGSLTRAQMSSFLARTLDLLVAQGTTSVPRR
jgi:hypothetical protein